MSLTALNMAAMAPDIPQLREGAYSVFDKLILREYHHDDWSFVFEPSVLRTFLNNNKSPTETLQAIIKEEAEATKTEITTDCPPLPRPLASQADTTLDSRCILAMYRLIVKKTFCANLLKDILDQAEVLRGLCLEHEMLTAMRRAGVNPDGALLGPIVTELRDRTSKYFGRKDYARPECIRARKAMDDAQAQWLEASDQFFRQKSFWWWTRKTIWWYATASMKKVRKWWVPKEPGNEPADPEHVR